MPDKSEEVSANVFVSTLVGFDTAPVFLYNLVTKTERRVRMTETKKRFDISSFGLHILAMLFMLSDHLWATVVPGSRWMTAVGRLAFPIFAFMIAEGFYRTRSVKKYILRLLIFAVLSEIPFNLMYGGAVFYPVHQNVLWTFLAALAGICLIDRVKKREKQKKEQLPLPEPDAPLQKKCLALCKKNFFWRTILAAVPTVAVTAAVGQFAMLDFFGAGVLMVYIFYFFRGKKWWCMAAQFAAMLYVNAQIGGMCYNVTLFGHTFALAEQCLAVLALIPIWLYHGRQGYHSKWFQYFCYAFYPAHALVLVLLQRLFT